MATPTPTPSCGLNGSSKDIAERAFMAGSFVSGVGYGIQLVLYIWCTMFLIRQRKDRKYSTYMWAYITLLLMVETVLCVAWARMVEVTYISDRNHPMSGGTWGWRLKRRHTLNITYSAALFSLTFLSDLLVLWRCWVIWAASGKRQAYLATLFPTVMLLASFPMGAIWILKANQPKLYLCGGPPVPLSYGVAYGALSFGVNIVLTLLIVLRLWLYRRNLISRLPKHYARHYMSLAAIIVESAALYSLFAILFLIMYAVGSPVHQVFLAFASLAQQISSYLIIYRVADGSAFNSKALTIQATAIDFSRPPLPPGGGSTDTVQLSKPLPPPA